MLSRSLVALRIASHAFAGALLLGACAQAPETPEDASEVTVDGTEALSCTNPAINRGRSLFVTDATVLSRFALKAVMDKIIATAGTGARQTSLQLYRQWWDLNNDSAHARTTGPHCDDIPQPFDCPRQEGVLADTDPFTNVGTSADSYIPLALVNRFDLAPRNGANCGEYRIVYGKVSGQSAFDDRNLLIFEAKLPNPDPSLGIAACRPVAELWANLTAVSDATNRANQLQNFYFNGLSGFEPVIHFNHYLGTAINPNSGQIRTNQFMARVSGQPWELREYRLENVCPTSTTCKLVMKQARVKVNPKGELFSEVAPGGGLTTFQTDFVNNQVSRLIRPNLAEIALQSPTSSNGFQSEEQSTDNDYGARVANPSAFRTAIRAKLGALRSPLSAENVLDRATTQSCAGCHQLSAGVDIGGGLTWPLSNGFTQIDENRTLSPALTQANGFLDIRKNVLISFLCPPATPASLASTSAAESDGSETLGGFTN